MLTRRTLLALAGASLLCQPASAQEAQPEPPRLPGGATLEFGPAEPFSWESLISRARQMRDGPFKERLRPVDELLRRIGYEQHHAIYQPTSGGMFAAPGRDGIVTGFHLSELHRRPVKLHRLEDGEARELLYRRGYFSYPEGSAAGDMPDDAGFAGFRVHEPWRDEGEPGDWLVFLGASYFRSSGDLSQYGISARGLALDTAPPEGKDEEFPAFTEFWISQMEGGLMEIYALLDSESATGAYRFEVRHFPNVVMDVEARIFMRRDVSRFGAAPLTSMYWYSQERRWSDGDWRPEIHDSDGLLIGSGDDFLWRALDNPPGEIAVSSFPLPSGAGFGLMQRDRDYNSYQDRAAFERRPNLWVEPVEGFEEGEVQLVELPTTAEFGDNIVAFFVPRKEAKADEDFSFRYRLHWSGGEPPTSLARMIAHRHGEAALNDRNEEPRHERKVMADFAGGPLAGADPATAETVVEPSRGEAFKPNLMRLPYRSDAWRLEFDLFSQDADPVDIRIRIEQAGKPLTEDVVLRIWPEEDVEG